MPITFYPHEDDISAVELKEKIEILLSAAERYRSAILDPALIQPVGGVSDAKSRMAPKDIPYAFQWQELAIVLRKIRELPENNQSNRSVKIENLMRLSEIYEVLRSAKMPKLEAVRLALVDEANHLRSTSAA
jgi:hypothetical protein